ncbi:hypothetical protein HY492_00690 [Candidatus Woesearchaeota archaeon]|nr:hypothetical protein [Candidatus Woesearchaeota archaeon]
MFSFLRRLMGGEEVERQKLRSWLVERKIEDASLHALAGLIEQAQTPDVHELEHIQKDFDIAEQRIKALEQDARMNEVQDAKQKLQTTIEHIRTVREPFLQEFETHRALLQEKLSQAPERELLESYLAKPIETLARDRDLVIVTFINGPRWNKQQLAAFLRRYGTLMLQQDTLVNRIASYPVFHELSNVRARVRMLQEQLQKAQQKVDAERTRLEHERTVAEETFLAHLKTFGQEIKLV